MLAPIVIARRHELERPTSIKKLRAMTVPTIRVDELQRWTLLLDHLAHWLSRADGVTCDHYQGFAATSCSYRDSDLLDMVFALTGIICRLVEVP